jgi:hypothetical protein
MFWRRGLVLVLLLGLGCSRTPTVPNKPVEPLDPDLIVGPAGGKGRPPAPNKEGPPPKPSSPSNPAVTATKDTGVISGIVLWGASMPDGALKPRLRVDPESKGVADVVVWLVAAPGEAAPVPDESATLVQAQGSFQPHVQALRRGTSLKLATNDERADFHATGAATFSVTLTRGQTRPFPLSKAGVVEVSSELNPAVPPALVHVLEHAYFAVTGPDGRFRLPVVPAGEYQLVLWHENWRAAEGKSEPLRVQVPLKLAFKEGVHVEWAFNKP